MNSLISYSTFVKDRLNFKRSGTRTGSDFNKFDTPSHSFFKILFYFWNGDDENNENMSGGLLAPTWEVIKDDKYYEYNSAWSYLKLNDENERAEKLKQFVTLLSNINTESPWYFSEITGMEEILERKQTMSDDFKIEGERKKISIKCLPDSFDQRIGTLLSLYRDIVWSWSNKREVVPANLRKFDMGLYIYESPMGPLTDGAVLDEISGIYSSSYRLIEFHNCEFDYNAIKTGFSSLTNKEGFQNEYTIDIYFDDYYEHNYNSIMMRTIGDVIITDTSIMLNSYEQGSSDSKYNNLSIVQSNINDLQSKLAEASGESKFLHTLAEEAGESKFLHTLAEEAVGSVIRDIKSTTNRLLLGNLYSYSISRMADQLQGILKGQVNTAISAIDQYADTNIMDKIHNNSLNNLAGKGQKFLNEYVQDRKHGRIGNKITSLGKLYQAKTLINNI